MGAGFQTTVLPISAGAVGRFPAIAVKLNGVIARTKPSSGRWSKRFHTPGHADRLLLRGSVARRHVEPPEVGQLARRVDLGLIAGLALARAWSPRSAWYATARQSRSAALRKIAARSSKDIRCHAGRGRLRGLDGPPDVVGGRVSQRAQHAPCGAAGQHRSARRRRGAAPRRSSWSARPARRPSP